MKLASAVIVVVLGSARIGLPQTVVRQGKPPAVVAKNAAGGTVASIPIGRTDSVVATVRSLDEKLIFVLLERRGGSGVLDIVDLGAGTVTDHAAASHPTRFFAWDQHGS